MEKLAISGSTGKSKIFIGEKLNNLKNYLPHNRVVIITDINVKKLYYDFFPKYRVIEIGEGEKIKNLETLNFIYEKLLEYEVDRSFFIVGIGGGIVCDIAGFIASTYMRGVDFGFVSTTLLSQVDASIGGKNGVNFQGYKNIIGLFSQPQFVICDLELLQSLNKNEFKNGFAEIVKYSLIKNGAMFNFLEENYLKALNKDVEILERLIFDSLIIKSAIVKKDEKERGERRKLNFGHTFAHALEKQFGLSHGEAVSIGMVIASNISVVRGYLEHSDAERIRLLLKNLSLPVNIEFDKKLIIKNLKKDKKREGDIINFVLLKNIGNATIDKISIKELEEIINDMC